MARSRRGTAAPVVLVTGDEATCVEATGLLGAGLTTVAVKKGLGRFSARQIPPLRARELIEEGADIGVRERHGGFRCLRRGRIEDPGIVAQIGGDCRRVEPALGGEDPGRQ